MPATWEGVAEGADEGATEVGLLLLTGTEVGAELETGGYQDGHG